MNPKLRIIPVLLAVATLAHSQEELSSISRDSATASATLTAARIIGDIPDGTPPLPEPPKPEFVIPAKDVLEATIHQLKDGRTVTIQRIKPIDLPPPPKTVSPTPEVARASTPEQIVADLEEQEARILIVSLGATVYRSKDLPPRSLVTYSPNGKGETITFWSSADFSLLTGVSSFIANDGNSHMLFLMCGSEIIDSSEESREEYNPEYKAPQIPDLPEGKAIFKIVGKPPAVADLVPIQSLHDLYNQEFQRLQSAFQGRKQARIQYEADLKAHPPQPKDITLNYWRTEKPAPATVLKGGAR
jgi:hypothetical protein